MKRYYFYTYNLYRTILCLTVSLAVFLSTSYSLSYENLRGIRNIEANVAGNENEASDAQASSKIKAIIFDFDETLYIWPEWLESMAMNIVYRALAWKLSAEEGRRIYSEEAERIFAERKEQLQRDRGVESIPTTTVLGTFGIVGDDIDRIVAEQVKLFEIPDCINRDTAKLISLLKQLSSECTLIVVSNSATKWVEEALAAHKLLEFFVSVIGLDEAGSGKPKLPLFQLAMQHLIDKGIEPGEVVAVSHDEEKDITPLLHLSMPDGSTVGIRGGFVVRGGPADIARNLEGGLAALGRQPACLPAEAYEELETEDAVAALAQQLKLARKCRMAQLGSQIEKRLSKLEAEVAATTLQGPDFISNLSRSVEVLEGYDNWDFSHAKWDETLDKGHRKKGGWVKVELRASILTEEGKEALEKAKACLAQTSKGESLDIERVEADIRPFLAQPITTEALSKGRYWDLFIEPADLYNLLKDKGFYPLERFIAFLPEEERLEEVFLGYGCKGMCWMCLGNAPAMICQKPFPAVLKEAQLSGRYGAIASESMLYEDYVVGAKLSDFVLAVLAAEPGFFDKTTIIIQGWSPGNRVPQQSAEELAASGIDITIHYSIHFFREDTIRAYTIGDEEEMRRVVNRRRERIISNIRTLLANDSKLHVCLAGRWINMADVGKYESHRKERDGYKLGLWLWGVQEDIIKDLEREFGADIHHPFSTVASNVTTEGRGRAFLDFLDSYWRRSDLDYQRPVEFDFRIHELPRSP